MKEEFSLSAGLRKTLLGPVKMAGVLAFVGGLGVCTFLNPLFVVVAFALGMSKAVRCSFNNAATGVKDTFYAGPREMIKALTAPKS